MLAGPLEMIAAIVDNCRYTGVSPIACWLSRTAITSGQSTIFAPSFHSILGAAISKKRDPLTGSNSTESPLEDRQGREWNFKASGKAP